MEINNNNNNFDSNTCDSNTIGPKLAPYNPTNLECVQLALNLLNINENDILYDLGCGDGRFLLEATKRYGIKSVGIEYDLNLCERALQNITNENLTDKTQVIHANVLDVDFSEATVIFVYLVPEGILAIKDRLLDAINRGVRIVTYVFSIPDLTPITIELYKKSTKLYLYKKLENSLENI